MVLNNRSEEGRRDGAACKDEITCRNKTGQVRKKETRAAGHDDSSAKYTPDEPLVRGDNLSNRPRVQYMVQSHGGRHKPRLGVDGVRLATSRCRAREGLCGRAAARSAWVGTLGKKAGPASRAGGLKVAVSGT